MNDNKSGFTVEYDSILAFNCEKCNCYNTRNYQQHDAMITHCDDCNTPYLINWTGRAEGQVALYQLLELGTAKI